MTWPSYLETYRRRCDYLHKIHTRSNPSAAQGGGEGSHDRAEEQLAANRRGRVISPWEYGHWLTKVQYMVPHL